MTAPSTLVDMVAQLRRRWSIVAAGALIGLVIGFAAGAPSPALAAVLVAVLFGILAGFVVAFALVALHPRVTTVADIRRVTGLPVIAQLPSAVMDGDDLDDRPTSRRMRTTLREAVMNTRTLAGGSMPGRIVLARTDAVSEVVGVDGGFARALVESGYAAALLHTDLESRMEARPSTVAASPLDDDSSRPDASGYEREPVPDRIASARPADRLERVTALLASLGDRYDVTVAQAASNSAPVPLRGIAPAADAVLIVVRSNRTTVESVLAVYGELLSVGVQPLGVILTGVAARHRVLLRNTWAATDFRTGTAVDAAGTGGSDTAVGGATGVGGSPVVAAPVAVAADDEHDDFDDFGDFDDDQPRLAGFSIADLVSRTATVTSIGRRPSGADTRSDQIRSDQPRIGQTREDLS